MNLIQIIASNSSWSKHRKAQTVTLLFVNNLLESLDTILHQRWLPKKNDFIVFVFLYINISLRFVLKFAFVAMNVRFLYIICNFEIFSTVN